MDARQMSSYPSSLLAILTRTLNPSAIPQQAPTASSEYLAYLTSDLPSHYGAYTALDTPCPRGPFVTAFASIATDECIFYRIAPPLSRLDCMCTSFLPAMISNIESDTGPVQCGSGVLAELAIASATQAVRDVCNWRQGPQTVYTQTGLVPASYASLLSFERSQFSEIFITTSTSTEYASSTASRQRLFSTTAPPVATATGSDIWFPSSGSNTNQAAQTATASNSEYGYGSNSGYGYGYSSDNSHNGLSGGAIAGIALGLVAFVAILVVGVLLMRRYYKRKYAAAAAATTAEAPEPAPQVITEKYAPKGKGPEISTKGIAVEGKPKPIGMPRWG